MSQSGNYGSSSPPAVTVYPITPYVVGPEGEAQYQTIQAALDAANTAGGGAIYVQPGTYTEDLTLYLNTSVIGVGGNANTIETSIVGVHTPPDSGPFSFSNVFLESSTDVFNSSSAGGSDLSCTDCTTVLTNGYTFNCPNWTSEGSFNLFNVTDGSTVNGISSNTNSCLLSIIESTVGSSSTKSMACTGVTNFYNSRINCPVTFSSISQFTLNNTIFTESTTCEDSSTGIFDKCRWDTDFNSAVIFNSTQSTSIVKGIINTSASEAISGTGTGTLTVDCLFLDIDNLSSSLVFGNSNLITPTFKTIDEERRLFLRGNTIGSEGSIPNVDIVLDPQGAGGVTSLSSISSPKLITTTLTVGNIFATQDRTQNIGSTTNSFGTLFINGISFDDGANSMTAYVSGTWEPTIFGAGGSAGSQTYATQNGRYIRIGNMVAIWFHVSMTNKGSWSGDTFMGNLPYDPIDASVVNWYAPLTGTNVTFTGTSGWLVGLAETSQSAFKLVNVTTASTTADQDYGGIQNTTNILGGFVYNTA